MVIDCFGLSENELKLNYPSIHQWLYEKVKPERDQNNRKSRRENWWLFGEQRKTFRPALEGLSRFISRPETAKHCFFVFLDISILPDNKLVNIAIEDAYFLGVLSCLIHIQWALAVGGRLGVGNDPVYVKSKCFDCFPFPDPSEELKQEIRELGERLDSHRKQVQAAHPEVTITAMYNCLEKMRRVEPFTDADREFNNKALISTLKQIHDDLDQAVFRAYGWDDLIPLWQQTQTDPNNSELKEQLEQTILQRLVDLNAERAEEERNGLIRWLRPEYQAPDQITTQKVIEGIDIEEEKEIITPTEQQKFPTKLKDQLAAIRDLLRTQGGEWTTTQIITQFKGKTKIEAIQNCLEILEDLGVIFSHTETQTKRYYAAEFQNIT